MLLVSLGIGLTLSYAQAPVFRATATFVAAPTDISLDDRRDLVNSVDTLANRSSLVSTYCNIMESHANLEKTVAALGLPSELVAEYQVDCVVLPDSNVLRLLVEGASPDLVADLANGMGAAGLSYISTLHHIYELRQLDPAVADPEPISPNHTIDLALSAAVGLMSGAAFVLLRLVLSQPLSGQQLSIIDASTGIANVRYLQLRLEEELTRARLQNHHLSLATLALEPLGGSEHYPLALRQRLKRQVAVFLEKHSRPLDLIAYLRDDTFAILMPETSGPEASELLTELLEKLRVHAFTLGDDGRLVVFNGVAGIVETDSGAFDTRTMLTLSQQAVEEAAVKGPYQLHLRHYTTSPYKNVPNDIVFVETDVRL